MWAKYPETKPDRNGVQVRKENEKFTGRLCAHILHTLNTLNLDISRCCFADDGKEIYNII